MSFQTMEWTKESTIRLIELFREKQELWEPKCPTYKNREKKQDAWMDMAKSMGMDKMLVEKKMRSLIGQFQREQKKLKLQYGTDDESESKWFAYPLLIFLKDKTKPRPIGLQNSQSYVEPYYSDYVEDIRDGDTSDGLDGNRKRKMDTADNHNDTYAIMKNVYNTIQKDEYHFFGQHIACKIRKLSSSYARSTVQHHINNILYQAELGQFDQRPRFDSDTCSSQQGYYPNFVPRIHPAPFAAQNEESPGSSASPHDSSHISSSEPPPIEFQSMKEELL